MSKAFKRSILGISVALVLVVFLGGFGPSKVRAGTDKDGAYREIEVYSEVLKKVQTDYVVEPNITKVTNGALHGLLESLDSESSYLSPEEYKQLKQHQAEGTAQVGIVVSKRYGYASVVSVMPGSPAEKQQVENGDIVESIGDQSTREMSVAMIRLLLEGKSGTDVAVSLVRPRKAEPEKVSMTRSAIPVPALAEQQYENSSILYLKPAVLTTDRVNEIENRLRAMPKNSNKKVLLDLRNVAEGDEVQAIRLANAFLQSGTIATLEGQKFPKQTFAAEAGKFITSAPLVVLVNHGTSGAGEMLAAAILDNKRGDLVGERTFGEGTVVKTIELPDGAAVILSIAKYASPSGKKIQDEAVTPNVVVAAGQPEAADPDEPSAPLTAGKLPAASPPPAPKTDEQLNKALDLLKQKKAA